MLLIKLWADQRSLCVQRTLMMILMSITYCIVYATLLILLTIDASGCWRAKDVSKNFGRFKPVKNIFGSSNKSNHNSYSWRTSTLFVCFSVLKMKVLKIWLSWSFWNWIGKMLRISSSMSRMPRIEVTFRKSTIQLIRCCCKVNFTLTSWCWATLSLISWIFHAVILLGWDFHFSI